MTETVPTRSKPVEHAYAPYRFTAEKYYRMGEVGLITDGERVELIDGQILVMEPIGPPHGGSVKALNHVFTSALGDRAIVGVQVPVHVDRFNVPQPDLTICRPCPDFYSTSHPEPPDVYLVVESAWSSLPGDRKVKVPMYGRVGIPEFWIIDIRSREVEVYHGPYPDGYRYVRRYAVGDVVTLQALPDVSFAVADLFPG